MLTIRGNSQRLCDGLTRRALFRVAGAGLLGTSLTKLLAAEEAGLVERPRAKSVMFLFLYGGPSQLETFDMKPEAPSEIRGPFGPIASRTPGMRIREDLTATVYHALGISPDTRVRDALGRPVPVMEGGQPLLKLFG